MPVVMMQIRDVGMVMRQANVAVGVRVRPFHGRDVSVKVMFVVRMQVLMVHAVMGMGMGMSGFEQEKHSDCHHAASQNVHRRQPFVKQQNGRERTDKRC